MYKIIFERGAVHNLDKLDWQIKERIWDKLQECKENPFRFLKYLIEMNVFCLRVGDYRVLIDIDRNLKLIRVLKLGLRKNIYQN